MISEKSEIFMLDYPKNAYEKLYNRKLAVSDVAAMERNLSNFIDLLIEIDKEKIKNEPYN